MSIIEDIEQLERYIDRANIAARSEGGKYEGGTAQYWTNRAKDAMAKVRGKVDNLEVERNKLVKLMLEKVVDQ